MTRGTAHRLCYTRIGRGLDTAPFLFMPNLNWLRSVNFPRPPRLGRNWLCFVKTHLVSVPGQSAWFRPNGFVSLRRAGLHLIAHHPLTGISAPENGFVRYFSPQTQMASFRPIRLHPTGP